jgi:hypothetical protein
VRNYIPKQIDGYHFICIIITLLQLSNIIARTVSWPWDRQYVCLDELAPATATNNISKLVSLFLCLGVATPSMSQAVLATISGV